MPAIASSSEPVPNNEANAPDERLTYDAFISYSHAKDKSLAAALQSTVQRLGKSWYQRRALRVFRDDTALSASPHLWPDIEKALEQSRFLILFASPEAASSPWVDKELVTWFGRNGPETVLIALTDGELAWDNTGGDFRWSEVSPLPPSLKGRFADEPRWIDLRAYRQDSSPRDARFADLAADFAAALHGRPKEDLLSQEVRQQRRALRLAGAAVGLLVVLLGLAGWQWTVARTQRNRAEHDLALATETASGLVFDLAQKFRDFGTSTAVISDILGQARKLQDQLSRSGETTPDLLRSESAALGETVITWLDAGDTQQALAAAQREREITQTLLVEAPGNAEYQSDLAVSDDRIGDVQVAQGNLDAALGSYRTALAIAKRLAQDQPAEAEWQRELAVSYSKIGDVLIRQQDFAGALAAYRESHAAMKTATQKDPTNPQWQADLAASSSKIGDALVRQGDFAGALAAYHEVLAVNTVLGDKDPNNTRWQEEIGLANGNVGDVLQRQGDVAGALASYRAGLGIFEALSAKDLGNTRWQTEAAIAGEQVGDMLSAQENRAGALAAYRGSQGVFAGLTKKDAGNSDWQRQLGLCDSKIGDTLEAQGDLGNALVWFRESLAIFKTLVQKDPRNPFSLEWASSVGTKIGRILLVQAKPAEAGAALSDARALAQALVQRNPANAAWQSGLALCDYGLAMAGDNRRANLTEALDILHRLDAAGKLTADQKGLLTTVEAALEETR